MLILKMMSGEDLPDSNTCKSFSLVEVRGLEYVNFSRASDGTPVIEVHGSEGPATAYHPQGNTYVMSEQGRTVASFGYMNPIGDF